MVERIKAYAHDTRESIVHLINYKDTTFVLFCDEISGAPHQRALLISRSYSGEVGLQTPIGLDCERLFVWHTNE